jgi:hypothetical protein
VGWWGRTNPRRDARRTEAAQARGAGFSQELARNRKKLPEDWSRCCREAAYLNHRLKVDSGGCKFESKAAEYERSGEATLLTNEVVEIGPIEHLGD